MKHVLACLFLAACAPPEDSVYIVDTGWTGTRVELTTTLGAFTLGLEDELAPITTTNFLAYVDSGFFDGDDGEDPTVFHRVISGFMVQDGGMTAARVERVTLDPIVNESSNGLSNARGTVAMARLPAADTATSQFFINHVDNGFLDVDGDFPPGYAVFGKVLEGIEVVDAIAATPVTSEWPDTEVIITDCERVE